MGARILWLAAGAALFVFAVAAAEDTPVVKSVCIVTGGKSSEPELKGAAILKARILKRSAIRLESVREDAPNAEELMGGADRIFVVGTTAGNALASRLVAELGAVLPRLPNSDRLHPEGFAVKSGMSGGRSYVVVAGTDPRGTIYGVGHLLRALTYLPDSILAPELNVTDKPAFWLRGGRPTGPGSRARQFGNLRPQTAEEQTEMMEDLMLLGPNIFEGPPDLIRSYGMMTVFGRTANEMSPGFPEEWRADGGRASRYVCPSIPEARKALLDSFDQMFRDAPDYDFFTTNSGDEGGCRCAKCMPWGDKYIRLVHDIADLLHKYHPNTKVLATNQDLTNEGNQAIFDYLNSGDSSWLFALRYGPGADEMQTYIRGPVNSRWFEYEGFGSLGNYLKFMHHELPRENHIVLYSDITHWMQAQFAVPHPDVTLAAVYDRRSWNARPNHLYKVAREILHYAVGDMHYSEGMHDDFNKWFWYRMLWNPNQDGAAITRQYCRYWFGPAAEQEAAAAIYYMEATIENPVLDNPGVDKSLGMLRKAQEKIPENLLKNNYRWRIIMQKALMDRYIQFKLEQGRFVKEEAGRVLEQVENSAAPLDEAAQALAILEQPPEVPGLATHMEQALKLGEESNAIIGYREPAPFLVDKFDLAEVEWWTKTLREAIGTGDSGRVKNAARMILRYTDAGEGGVYEDLGWPNEAVHLKRGETLWGFMPFAGPAKHSHWNLAYSMGTNEGVALEFDGLDSAAQYVVRLSVGVHVEDKAPELAGVRLAQGLTADGATVSEGFPVPVGEVAFQEFDIPRAATADGKVRLELTPQSPVFPVTGLNEIWLMRKDKMPWTCKP